MAATAVTTTLSGVRKAAVFTVLLGEESSTAMFKYLHEDEIEQIAREVAILGSVPATTGEQVLEEFHNMWQAAEFVARGGVEYARKLLVKSLGADMARRLLDKLVTSFESTVVFTAIEKADPQQLSKFILAEHPQTIALILAHLRPSQAAQLVGLLPDDVRVEVLTRMANLDEISP